MIGWLISLLMGVVLGWVIKMPFSYAFLKRELNENMKILEKINDLRRQRAKAVIK